MRGVKTTVMPIPEASQGRFIPARQAAMQENPHRRDVEVSVGITRGQGPDG